MEIQLNLDIDSALKQNEEICQEEIRQIVEKTKNNSPNTNDQKKQKGGNRENVNDCQQEKYIYTDKLSKTVMSHVSQFVR